MGKSKRVNHNEISDLYVIVVTRLIFRRASVRDRWNARYAAHDRVWSGEPHRAIAEHLSPLTPGRALDVACGEGRHAIWLAQQGWQVDAFDFSSVGVVRARDIAGSAGADINLWVGDATRLPVLAPYDLVLVAYLHTDPAERAQWLPGAVDLVAPGGCFFYVGHDPSNIDKGVGGPQDPSLLIDAASMQRDYLQNFDIIEAGVLERDSAHESGHAAVHDQSARAIDTVVFARRRIR